MSIPLALRIAAVIVLLATPSACTSSGSGAPAASPVTPTTSASRTPSSVSTSTTARTSTSSSTTQPTTSATLSTGAAVLVSTADRICSVGNAYRTAHPFPFPNFDPTDPTVRDLPAVAAYLKRQPDVASRLLRLDLPLDVATALAQERKNATALIAAAKDSDPQTFAHVSQDRKAVGQRLYAAARAAGLAAATACSTYFRT